MRAHVIRVWNGTNTTSCSFICILVAVVQKRVYIFPSLWILGRILPQLHFHFVFEHCLFRCQRKGNKLSLKFSFQKSICGSTFFFLCDYAFHFFPQMLNNSKPPFFSFSGEFHLEFKEAFFCYLSGSVNVPLDVQAWNWISFVGFPALKWFEQTLVSLVILKSFLLMSCDHLLYKLGRGHR